MGVGGAPSCQHPAPNPAVSLQGALGPGLVSPVSARTEVWAFGFRASWPCWDPREVLRRKPRLCGPGEQLEAGAALTSIKEGSRPCPLSLLCALSGAWEGAELSGGRLRPTTLQTRGAVVGGRLTFPSPYPEHRSPPVSRTELPGALVIAQQTLRESEGGPGRSPAPAPGAAWSAWEAGGGKSEGAKSLRLGGERGQAGVGGWHPEAGRVFGSPTRFLVSDSLRSRDSHGPPGGAGVQATS